jgi:hypothetical protein
VLLYDRPVPFAWMSEVGHPPTELRIDALTRQPGSAPMQPASAATAARPPLRKRTAAAVVALPALGAIAVLVGTGALGTGAGLPAHTAVEHALALAEPTDFAELGGATGVSCRPTAKPKVFDCAWRALGESNPHGLWELYNGDLARVSDGGDSGGAPTTDAQATQLVRAALRQRGPSTADASCRQLIIDGEPADQLPREYTCELLENGQSVGTDAGGDPIRTVWSWNPDGSVANESNDDSPVADETTR